MNHLNWLVCSLRCPRLTLDNCPECPQTATTISSQIDSDIQRERRAMASVVRLLLLGTSDSGKSTLLKQFRILHTNGFSAQELSLRSHTIQAIVVSNMVKLCMYLQEYGLKLDTFELRRDRDYVLNVVDKGAASSVLDGQTKCAIRRLWHSDAIQTCFERRDDFHLPVSAKYFFSHLERILDAAYVPSNDDMLQARVQTIGVDHIQFTLKSNLFCVTDVGGQRTQRRKWIHFFDNVHAVIFMLATSEFDQYLAEDESTNRLLEAMELYQGIVNCRWFKRSSIIMFLNKMDLLKQKLAAGKSISSCFHDYNGKGTYEESILFLRDKLALLKEPNVIKQVYMHETCATDTKRISKVINCVTDTLLDRKLSFGGLTH